MFFHPVDEGSISLAVVGRRAVQVGNFVDGVGGKVGRSSLGLGEVSFSSGGRVCHFDVVLSKNYLQGFGEGGMVGYWVGRRRGRSLEPVGWFVEVWEG